MGVNLVFDGFCERCLCADLELTKIDFHGKNYERLVGWKVKCAHEEGCRHVMDIAKDIYSEPTFEKMNKDKIRAMMEEKGGK